MPSATIGIAEAHGLSISVVDTRTGERKHIEHDAPEASIWSDGPELKPLVLVLAKPADA